MQIKQNFKKQITDLTTGLKESFVRLSEHESPHKVKLVDDYQYPIKGSEEYSYKLDSGMQVAFIDGQIIM